MRFLVVPFVLAGATACGGQPTAPSRALITTPVSSSLHPLLTSRFTETTFADRSSPLGRAHAASTKLRLTSPLEWPQPR